MDHLISITSNCVTNIFNECKSVGFLFPKKDIFVVNYLFFLRGGGHLWIDDFKKQKEWNLKFCNFDFGKK